MAKLEEDFVKMQCPNCGGEVQIDKATYDEHYLEMDGGNVAVYMGTIQTGEGATCTHCGTKFQRRQRLEVTFNGSGNLRVDTGGGAWIGGNVNTSGGDFVGRDKTSVTIRGNVSGGSVIVTGNGNRVQTGRFVCPECGAPYSPQVKFCANCGQKLK